MYVGKIAKNLSFVSCFVPCFVSCFVSCFVCRALAAGGFANPR